MIRDGISVLKPEESQHLAARSMQGRHFFNPQVMEHERGRG